MGQERLTAAEIVALRQSCSRTQQEMADHIGVHIRTYQRWEGGECPPSGAALKGLQRLAGELQKRKTDR